MAAQRLKDLLDFLAAVNARDEHSHEKQERLLQNCLQDLINGPPITMAEGTVMVKDVGDSPIPEWMKTIVTQSVQDKMLSTTSAAKKVKVGNGTQRNTHLENYFTQEDWGVLRNEAQGVNMKLHLFKRVFHSIRACLQIQFFMWPATPVPSRSSSVISTRRLGFYRI